jgi:predicted RNase H-like HicB family nuclease
MTSIKIIIERTKNLYSAYAENVEGIYGGGSTVEEAKKSIVDAIKLFKKNNIKENIPAILNEPYQLVFKY